MIKHPTDESRGLLFVHIQADQAISGMAQIAPIEIRVEREKRDTPQLEQIRDDLTILDPLLLCVKANLTGWNAPSS
jgi:hypothetical protein